VNVEPAPTSLFTHILPPCSSTNLRFLRRQRHHGQRRGRAAVGRSAVCWAPPGPWEGAWIFMDRCLEFAGSLEALGCRKHRVLAHPGVITSLQEKMNGLLRREEGRMVPSGDSLGASQLASGLSLIFSAAESL